jgi:hypothetical protein
MTNDLDTAAQYVTLLVNVAMALDLTYWKPWRALRQAPCW